LEVLKKLEYLCTPNSTIELETGSKIRAGVAELVDVLDLGSSAARRGGSIPSARTINKGVTGRRIPNLNLEINCSVINPSNALRTLF
jgi:hypothetical protein